MAQFSGDSKIGKLSCATVEDCWHPIPLITGITAGPPAKTADLNSFKSFFQ